MISSVDYSFPWCLKTSSINSIEFFPFIELFVKAMSYVEPTVAFSTAITNTGSSKTFFSPIPSEMTKEDADSTTWSDYFLDKFMVKHFSACEERTLEYLAWKEDSFIWAKLCRLELNSNYSVSIKSGDLELGTYLNYDLVFPVYDDVLPICNKPNVSILNQPAFHLSNDMSIVNSNKTNQIVTRVVCSQSNSDSDSSTNGISEMKSKKIQVICSLDCNSTRKTQKFSLFLFYFRS